MDQGSRYWPWRTGRSGWCLCQHCTCRLVPWNQKAWDYQSSQVWQHNGSLVHEVNIPEMNFCLVKLHVKPSLDALHNQSWPFEKRFLCLLPIVQRISARDEENLLLRGDPAASGDDFLQRGDRLQRQVHLQRDHVARVHEEYVKHLVAVSRVFYPNIWLWRFLICMKVSILGRLSSVNGGVFVWETFKIQFFRKWIS